MLIIFVSFVVGYHKQHFMYRKYGELKNDLIKTDKRTKRENSTKTKQQQQLNNKQKSISLCFNEQSPFHWSISVRHLNGVQVKFKTEP